MTVKKTIQSFSTFYIFTGEDQAKISDKQVSGSH